MKRCCWVRGRPGENGGGEGVGEKDQGERSWAVYNDCCHHWWQLGSGKGNCTGEGPPLGGVAKGSERTKFQRSLYLASSLLQLLLDGDEFPTSMWEWC